MTIEHVLAIALDREMAYQDHCLDLRARGQPHPNFRFRISFADFLKYFRSARCCLVWGRWCSRGRLPSYFRIYCLYAFVRPNWRLEIACSRAAAVALLS